MKVWIAAKMPIIRIHHPPNLPVANVITIMLVTPYTHSMMAATLLWSVCMSMDKIMIRTESAIPDGLSSKNRFATRDKTATM